VHVHSEAASRLARGVGAVAREGEEDDDPTARIWAAGQNDRSIRLVVEFSEPL
jgi:hypothetical protein